MKKFFIVVLAILSLAFFAAGVYCVREGFDKKDNYYNPESYSSLSENAYVGGDAYNYIINGTYFAGYCALGGALAICGAIAGASSIILGTIDEY